MWLSIVSQSWSNQTDKTRWTQAAVFALPDVQIPESKTMLDWAKDVEEWQGMPAVEIMVAMVENGYELQSEPAQAVRSLKREMSNKMDRN